MMETPDGDGRLELVKFHAPAGRGGDRLAPANTPGLRHLALRVDDIDAVVAGLRARRVELVSTSWGSLVRAQFALASDDDRCHLNLGRAPRVP
jgi:4-hydroxyphenylpyruvate dioxygenase-like putative hemolysin